MLRSLVAVFDTDTPAEPDVLWFVTAGKAGIAKLDNGAYAFVCGTHRIMRAVSSDPADLAAFRCDECEAHAQNAPYRRRFMQWVAGCLLLAMASTAGAEGFIVPVQTAPQAVAVTPARPAMGPSRWVFWSALAAQGATCATQEYAFAKFGVYGAAVGTRVRTCALNLGPVIAVAAFGRWMPRESANVTILPSVGWGVWGTAKNLYDIRQIDRLIKGAK